jgi:hypothetical protein
MTAIGQAYIHLKPYSPDFDQIDQLQNAAERICIIAALESYHTRNLKLEIELEDGSLKGRMTVIAAGLITALHVGHWTYGTIADYKGFRESVEMLCDEARDYGADVCGKFAHAAGASNKQVFRKERRLKTPGKVLRLMKKLERLEKNFDNLSPNDLKNELKKAREDLDSIADDLTPDDVTTLNKQLVYKKIGGPQNWPDAQATMPKVALRQRFGPGVLAPRIQVRMPDFDRDDRYRRFIDLSTYPIEQLGITFRDGRVIDHKIP